MKVWRSSLYGAAVLAGLTPPAFAQVAGIPGAATPASAGVAPVAVAATPAAAPQNNIWSFLCMTPEQKAACKKKFCDSGVGQMVNSMTQPLSFMSGGLVPKCCPDVDLLDLANKPPDGAEGVAGKIKLDEANAKKRRAAVRYLGTVDCVHWPEARDALVGALRGDTNECVRFEAALALGNGCCCNKKTIKALSITVAGTDEDGFPPETCERVRAAAVGALEHCLACYVEVAPVALPSETKQGETLPVPRGEQRPASPEPIPPPTRLEQVPPGGGAKAPERGGTVIPVKALTGAVKPVGYYRQLQSVSMKKIVADARAVLDRLTRTSVTSNGQALQDHSVTGILKNAVTAPRPAGPALSAEPPRAVVVKPVAEPPVVHEAAAPKPGALHIFSFTLNNKPAPEKKPAAPAPQPVSTWQASQSANPADGPKAATKNVTPVSARIEATPVAQPVSTPPAPVPLSQYGVMPSTAAPRAPIDRRDGPATPAPAKQTPPAAPAVSAAPAQLPPVWQPTAPVQSAPPAAPPQPPAPAPARPAPAPVVTPAPVAAPVASIRSAPPAVVSPALPAVPAPEVIKTVAQPTSEPAPGTAPMTPPRITLPMLMGMLKGRDADDREWAAGQLAILPAHSYPQVVSALQEATRDSSASVRLAALHSLASMQPEPGTLYAVAAPLARDPDGRVRAEALENLRRLGVVR